MKPRFTIILLLLSTAIFCQPNSKKDSLEFVVCEVSEPAIYSGGPAALRKLFSDSAIYPEAAYLEDVSGKVMVKFTIDEQGNAKDVAVVNGVCTELDQEALRLIKLMKPWKPATRNGKNTLYRHIQSFTFSLQTNPVKSKNPRMLPIKRHVRTHNISS